MERKYIVYIHTCPNNKVYIGITSKSPESRWGNGRGYRERTIFGKAIKKYGWDNIKHEILFEGLTEDEAKNKEKELIAQYKSNNKKYGYNMTEGGDGTVGYEPWNKGKQMTVEYKEKNRQGHLGITPWNKGKQMSEEFKQNCRQARLGKNISKETKTKLSEIMKKLKWWNNGEIAIRAIMCPEGFVAGKLKKKQ